jgi:RHS repeat-associated protein
VTVRYHSTDLVRSIKQAGRTTEYTLDVNGRRIRSWTDGQGEGAQVLRRHHYGNDNDSPAWTDEGNGSFTAPVASTSGMAAIASTAGIDWQITNLHGDLVATIHNSDPGLTSTHENDEFGNPRNAADVGTHRYGWLGSSQRAADTPSGMILMGVRLYNTATGRFLQTDPVYGGTDNPYAYPADPVNYYDITGQAATAVVPLAAISGLSIAVKAVIAILVIYAAVCLINGCTIHIPKTTADVPWPSRWSKSAKKFKNTKFLVYEIFYTAPQSGVKLTYKYGITRVGKSRPAGQITKCNTHYRRMGGRGTCAYRVKRTVTGFYWARAWEATYIIVYVGQHGHCPPGQEKSCR